MFLIQKKGCKIRKKSTEIVLNHFISCTSAVFTWKFALFKAQIWTVYTWELYSSPFSMCQFK